MKLNKTIQMHPPYRPPQPTFAPCPHCHALILPQGDGTCLTPALGIPHVCEMEERLKDSSLPE